MPDPKKHMHRHQRVFVKIDPYWIILFRYKLSGCKKIHFSETVSIEQPADMPEISADELPPEYLEGLRKFVAEISGVNKKYSH